jgi:hypothetical protein
LQQGDMSSSTWMFVRPHWFMEAPMEKW